MTTEPADATINATETDIPIIDLPPYWRTLDAGVIILTKILLFLIGTAFTVLVSSEVLSRYVLNQSISQVNSTSRFLLVWFFMIGAGLALRQGAHVGLDILPRALPPLHAAILYFVAQTLVLTFFVQMLWGGYLALGASWSQVEGSLGVSMAWVMSAFPIGFALLIYHQAALVFGVIRGFKRSGESQ
jgi:TRAP-type C4-dicarboxylate transport system permease small subunit